MKIVRYASGRRVRYGVLQGDLILSLAGPPYRGIKKDGSSTRLSEVRLLSPCLPSKIVAMGRNYRAHAEETHAEVPDEPLFFLKPSTAVIGPDDAIVYPDLSHRVDYEGELGVVIGARAHLVNPEEVMAHVFGYTCFNDVTARDLQAKDKQWTRAKGFDTFAAVGPWIETELDPGNLTVETRLNGQVMQHAGTRDLVFSLPVLISAISQVMTLLPGDVIATGTPAGIGPMQPGDTVEIEIEDIGVLKNHVVRR